MQCDKKPPRTYKTGCLIRVSSPNVFVKILERLLQLDGAPASSILLASQLGKQKQTGYVTKNREEKQPDRVYRCKGVNRIAESLEVSKAR